MTRVERPPLPGRRLAGVARGVAALALAALAGLAVAALAPQALGFSAHVVTSGSMAPRVNPGDVVLTQPTTTPELRTGQVLLVADPERPGGLLLHRLVSFDPAGNLVTRGDANRSDDSVHVAPSAVEGVARLRVPWVGLPSVWRAQGRFGAIALAAAVLAGAAVVVSQPLARRRVPGSSVRAGAPMTGARRSAVPTAVAVRGVIEEERVSAPSAGYSLPPVPPAVPRPAARGGRAAGPAGRRHRPGGDHSGCFDGGRLCGQPRR